MTTTDGRGGIDAALVERLVAEQFPQWAGLPVRPVEVDGWDNRTYRLGGELSVRLPSHASYAAAVRKEQRWLPELGPRLPLPVPVPVGHGRPGPGFPHPWTVNRWLPGETAAADRIGSWEEFAADLAGFLVALRGVDARGGPPAGRTQLPPRRRPRRVRRGDARVPRRSPRHCAGRRLAAVWDAARASAWDAAPVWVHGDVAVGNLLVRRGRLAAVLDFGSSAVGDPACDLVIAWTFLPDAAREVFREAVALDDATWARARGWALWKALLGLRSGTEGPDGVPSTGCSPSTTSTPTGIPLPRTRGPTRPRVRSSAIHGRAPDRDNGPMVEVGSERFEAMVSEALDGLPEELGELMSNVAVTVEHGEGPAGLLGLYQGIPLTRRTSSYAGVLPDRITIYRRAICAISRSDAEVVEQVRRTVVHEVGHHFGIGDARLREMGW